MFKEGDLVTVKNRPHKTGGCEAFHEQMEDWKEIGYQFVLTDSTHYYGQTCWYTDSAQVWVIGESDLEHVKISLENE